MKAEAAANEAKDKEEREKVDKLNQADSMIFQVEKQLKEVGDKIPADKKSTIEAALGKLKAAHEAKDVPACDAATAELSAAMQAAAQDIYGAQQGAGAQPGAQQPNAGGNDEPQDVDFEEVK